MCTTQTLTTQLLTKTSKMTRHAPVSMDFADSFEALAAMNQLLDDSNDIVSNSMQAFSSFVATPLIVPDLLLGSMSDVAGDVESSDTDDFSADDHTPSATDMMTAPGFDFDFGTGFDAFAATADLQAMAHGGLMQLPSLDAFETATNVLVVAQQQVKLAPEKASKCDVCHKGFSSVWALREHKLIHTKKFPFSCHQCGKGFCRKAKLNIHVRTVHHGEKKFKCGECGRAFSQVGARNLHVKDVHRKIKKFGCLDANCTLVFSRKFNLKRHVNLKHAHLAHLV